MHHNTLLVLVPVSLRSTHDPSQTPPKGPPPSKKLAADGQSGATHQAAPTPPESRLTVGQGRHVSDIRGSCHSARGIQGRDTHIARPIEMDIRLWGHAKAQDLTLPAGSICSTAIPYTRLPLAPSFAPSCRFVSPVSGFASLIAARGGWGSRRVLGEAGQPQPLLPPRLLRWHCPGCSRPPWSHCCCT